MVSRLLRLPAAPRRPTPPTRSRWQSASCGGARRQARSCRRGPQVGGIAMIASVRGVVAAVAPDGAVVEVGGVGLAVSCSPGTLARLRVGETGPAGHQPGGPRGLADPLRLRRRRRACAVRAAADRERRRAQARADHARPSTRRASCAGRSPPAISPRSPRCPASAARAPSGSSSSCATGSARSTVRPTGRARPGVTAVAPWRDQLAHALAGLGFSGKEAARRDRGGRRRRRRAPTRPDCSPASTAGRTR